MAHQITVKQALKQAGTTLDEIQEDRTEVPAVCSEGCLVELDGECPHGFQSVFIELGWV